MSKVASIADADIGALEALLVDMLSRQCAGPVAVDRGADGRVDPQERQAILLSLDPDSGVDRLLELLAPTGLLAALRPEPDAAFETELRARFDHVQRYALSPVTGAVLFPHQFAESVVGSLPALRERKALYLGSNGALPKLPSGLVEQASPAADLSAPPLAPSAPPPAKVQTRHAQAERRWPLFGTDGPAAERRRTFAMANRLLSLESRLFDTIGQRMSLEHSLKNRGPVSSGSGYFDFPRGMHGWPATAEGGIKGSNPYDRRPEDDVLEAGRIGQAFLDAFSLLGDTPDFAGAVECLNQQAPRLDLTASAPDVSIVVPIYGQLPYTLNCLHSLLAHSSRYSVEILVIDDCSPDGVSEQYLSAVDGIHYHRQAVNGGFIESCNAGGAMARGRFIVMLNNDTRVVANWLDQLIDSFAEFPAAGLVGSKLFYPDGSLQEAGGLIWRDGSAWNYGRDDDPNRPQYCHARQVDFISGCSIALPVTLWRKLGGFDPLFKPAYCEDVDLALRIVEEGREVWFQPGSRLIHYEGKTSGTDTSSGVKAYQVVNTSKLYMRWRKRLEAHRANGEAPYFERERRIRKRILIIDATTPTPNQDAGSVQTVLALKACQSLGYKPHFIPDHNYLYDAAATADLCRTGVECAYAPFDLNITDYLAQYGHLFDVVMVYRVTVLKSMIDTIRELAPKASLIFHVADLHFLREERQARLDEDEEALAAAGETKATELDLIARVDCTITHSVVEAAIIRDAVPSAPVVTWPLMFDFHGTDVPFDRRRDICFLGGYRHGPNVDAVRYFVREILPIIKEAEPDVRFIIAGANPTDEVTRLAGPDVIVTGQIDDLRDLFDAARVFVAPLRVGAGVKGKVMTALSYGLPIVSTPIGIEGTGLAAGSELLVADDAASFAAEVLRLYRDPELWAQLSQRGQAYMRDKLSPASGEHYLEEAIEHAHRHRLKLDRQ